MASPTIIFFVVAMIVAATTTAAEDQSAPSCGTKLATCAAYLNSSTTPPPSCCDPLKEALTKELPCICALFSDKQLLIGLGVDISQAINLPKHCGMSSINNACKPADEAPTPHSSASLPPPATAGGKDDNGVGKIAWTGVSSLLVLGTSLMLW
ncbi:PREDICTED: lipid transfer-like protein VAS [Ipomoea nil]|uniref:lipid transfer-like protein VAS n=1 Tax=Ipomoea nil TaxID=35883 RepID=UPI0009018D74|nr:PREDICTED: lipid transfer-like protein VAS [Ipomoea nil]